MPCEAPEFTEFSGRGGPIVIACATVSDVTRVLEAVQKGDPQAADQLLPLVYDELRKLAVSERNANLAARLF